MKFTTPSACWGLARWGQLTSDRRPRVSSTLAAASCVVPPPPGRGGPRHRGIQGLPGVATASRRAACDCLRLPARPGPWAWTFQRAGRTRHSGAPPRGSQTSVGRQ
eukprot:6617965-Alexandrium_andersonii.AAC.1